MSLSTTVERNVKVKSPKNFKYLYVLSLLIFFMGCAHLLSYYDSTTYKNLTDLKPEVLSLYETFTTDNLDVNQIATIRLKMAQMYEYEKGKGQQNVETAKQIKKIQDIFDNHVNARKDKGKWSSINLSNNEENIIDAFDIAIQTERLKNKNR